MGFFNKLKSALGYSDSDYDEDDELDGFNPAHRTPYVNPFKKDEPVPDLSGLEQPAEQPSTAVAEVKAAPVAEVEEQLPDGQTRTVLHLPAALAPIKLAIFPLTKKDGLPEKAQEIFRDLRFYFNCKYEEKDQIGKRYRRMDAIGCPYCVTVDQQTLEDNTVTLRDRDTMEQRRVAISDLRSIIEDKVSITSLLKNLI